MIVVTGATGFVGNVLLRALIADGTTAIRAVVRPGRSTTSIAGLEVELAYADVRDYDSLVEAFRGADLVYHLAGIVSIASGGFKRLRETNVEGTRNVIAACRHAGVRRLVYVSSVHAFVEPPAGTCLTEDQVIDPHRVRGPYAKTKAEATLLIRDAARQGLDAVTVHPSGIAGPYDFRFSDIGRLIHDCCCGRMRAYVRGTYDFVDVRDVAAAALAAADNGRTGEGYIVCGHRVAVSELLDEVEMITRAPSSRWRVPFGLARSASYLMPAYYWARRERPRFTPYALHVISSNPLMSHDKAQRELGFSARPIRDTLQDTVDWFRQQALL